MEAHVPKMGKHVPNMSTIVPKMEWKRTFAIRTNFGQFWSGPRKKLVGALFTALGEERKLIHAETRHFMSFGALYVIFQIAKLGFLCLVVGVNVRNISAQSEYYVRFDLTRAWPGSQPNDIDAGRGQANSQTNDRSETGEAAFERSRRDGSNAHLVIS